MRGLHRPVAATTGLVLAASLAACGGEEADAPTESPSASETSSPTASPRSPKASDQDSPGRPRVAETVATGLEVPWGIAFLPDGTALVTERDSRRVLAIDPDGGRPREVGVVDQAAPEGEGGLLGIAVSPDFEEDRGIYLYATTAEDNRVLRTEFAGGGLGPAEVVLDGIPKGFIHDGGRLAFGPDGHIYVSTGEAGEPSLAQDPDSLAGKILRITPEGDPAPGNPDSGSPVWSLGHRNVQGLAFDDADRLWASEFGDSSFDEVNLVRKDANYGWPEVEGTGGEPEFTDPLTTWSTDEASPSGLAWVDGTLWMAALQGERLWRIPTDGARTGKPQSFFNGTYGRLRTVAVAPDGRLWVATSNRDGRGEPAQQDDRILVVDPG